MEHHKFTYIQLESMKVLRKLKQDVSQLRTLRIKILLSF